MELRGVPPPIGRERERRKYVSFTVELDRTGGPLGLTLSTEEGEARGPEDRPITISSMTEDGLALSTKAIQLGDELVEVNGACVRGR